MRPKCLAPVPLRVRPDPLLPVLPQPSLPLPPILARQPIAEALLTGIAVVAAEVVLYRENTFLLPVVVWQLMYAMYYYRHNDGGSQVVRQPVCQLPGAARVKAVDVGVPDDAAEVASADPLFSMLFVGN